MGLLVKGQFDPDPLPTTRDPLAWIEGFVTPEEDFNARLRHTNAMFSRTPLPPDSPMLAKPGEFGGGAPEPDLEKAVEEEETEIVEDQLLEKRESPTSGRRRYLKAWLSSRLALGETVDELAAYAERHDPFTAMLIREVGRGLEK